jgi:hypothetical protein
MNRKRVYPTGAGNLQYGVCYRTCVREGFTDEPRFRESLAR